MLDWEKKKKRKVDFEHLNKLFSPFSLFFFRLAADFVWDGFPYLGL